MSKPHFASLETGLHALERVIKKALAEPRDGKPFMLGIVGPSGSGKTFLKNRLQELFPGTSCLPMDNYYHGQAYNQAHGIQTFDEPAALNLHLLDFHCALFNLGQPVVFVPSFGYDKPIVHNAWQPVPTSPLIIVEGLFILEEAVRQHLDYVVFLDVSSHSAFWRRIARDSSRTAQTPHEVVQMFINEVFPGYARYVLPKRELADMFVENDAFPHEMLQSASLTETQTKILLSDRDTPSAEAQEAKFARFVLLPLGFSIFQTSVQLDTFFVPSSWSCSLLPMHSVMTQGAIRLRRERLVGNDEEKHILSYRFPRKGKKQISYAFPVSVDIQAGLHALGYKTLCLIEKTRTIFRDKAGNEIALDIVFNQDCSCPGTQNLCGMLYAEVRSRDEETLQDTVSRLYAAGAISCIDKSYLDILLSPSA